MRGDKRQRTAVEGGVLECCERARALEQAGLYEEAREQLAEWWKCIGERPRLDGLGEREGTEVKLRVGCLTIWLGSARQVEGAQEVALDLLSECARTFDQLGETERHAEAEIGMAHAYLRKASYDEARVILRYVLGRLEPEVDYQALCAIVMRSIVECSAGAFEEAMRLHEKYAWHFEGDNVPPRLKATFHYNWAITYRKLGDIDSAFEQYAAAKRYLEEVNDVSRLAIVETSLGTHFYTLKSYELAIEHIQRSVMLYELQANIRGVAEANETLSRILVETGDFEGAERAARAAVNILSTGEEKGLFVEALASLGAALARQGRRREAFAVFGEAEEMAGSYVGRKAAAAVVTRMIEETIVPACLQSGLTLEEPVNLIEREMIKGALRLSDKSMTAASLRLGVEYDTLRYIIKNRHPDLREERTRVYNRPHRGIIRNSSSKVRKISDKSKKG